VDRADVAGVLEEAPRMLGPVVEVGAWAEQAGGRHPGVVGRNADRDRTTGVRAEQDDPCRFVQRQHVCDRVAKIVDPALQREVALALSAPTEVERHRDAAEFVRHPIDQLRERAAGTFGVERGDREAVTEDDGGTLLDRSRRARDVTGQRQPVRDEPLVHPRHVTASRSRPRLAVPSTGSGRRQRVAPVSRLGEGVGTETETDAVVDDLVDDRLVVPRVEVIDQLGSFVAEEAAVLVLRVMLHRDTTVAPPALTAPTNR
jgi:hypothetical protein